MEHNSVSPLPPSLPSLSLSSSAHVQQWKSEGRSAAWLHVPVDQIALVHEAHEEGFKLHHAREDEEGGGEVVLSMWLDNSRPCKLPHYASHQVGVCGK